MNSRIARTEDASWSLVTGPCAKGISLLTQGALSVKPFALGIAIATAFSGVANAGTTGDSPNVTGGLDPATMLTNTTNFILGPFGQTLGVLGIIGIGMAWMFGRASLGLVAGVIGGIVIMFGAGFLGNALMG